MTIDRPYHLPVLLDDVVRLMDPQPGKIVLDATVGGGGHAQGLLSHLMPGGRLIGLDQDADAIATARTRLAHFGESVTLVQARFDRIADILDDLRIAGVDGVLFDLGVSSHQLDTPQRGFSFKEADAPLSMRMDASATGPCAADLLNTLSQSELTQLIRSNSDEKWAARIAEFIVRRREREPFATAGQLVDTVLAAMPQAARPTGKHAATRTFQALRIAVNDEMTVLGHALESAVDRLNKGGTMAALSYHSIEDRTVKQFFARLAGRAAGEGPYGQRPPPILQLLTKKPIVPQADEVADNPRARSALLRAARRL